MNVSVLNKFRFVAVLTAMTCIFWGNVHPAMASERIDGISPEIFDCLKRNNINDEGYVTYGDNGDMWVGRGRPGDSGGVKMHYDYDPSQEIITLTGTGGWDPVNVLGKTQQGISNTAAKCRSGEFR